LPLVSIACFRNRIVHGSATLFCTPQPAPTRNETIAKFVQWASTDNGRLTPSPADGIAAFLSQQFPCPTRR
jgi:hypothetical protein